MIRWLRLGILATVAALVLVFAMACSLFWPVRGVPEFETVKARWTPSDAYLLDRHGEVLDAVRVDFGVRRFDWVPLAAVSPALVAAVVDGEDRRFWKHSGVDWLGMLGAVRDDLVFNRGRGASTISMQLAALADARVPVRSQSAWHRKWMQVRIARAIERRWSKQQILEAYLNLLGFRGELQGIGAATRVLADKDPSGLDLPESLVLAALLPAPNAKTGRIVARACARAAARKVFVSCEAIRATATTLLTKTTPADEEPRVAPQVARAVLKKPGQRVRTTLDGQTQRLVQAVLGRRLADLKSRNVRDGAALVVDNESGDVLAYVGSAGPDSHAGHVDGVRARRQAGSTLKPFLYELALERRYLTAASLLDDSPLHLDTATGVYLPQDYDKDFKGLVSVRTALGNSLNIPAVRTLVLTGVNPFRERLHELGYAGLTEEGDFYGYSLALGSAEVSLWEQAQAYRTLARGGRWSPIRLQSVATVGERDVLAQDASFVISDILSDRAARAITFGLDNHLNTSFWSAAKTGTSKDMRDNWCIGFSSHFTVAVWVGNFEGDAMHDVSGVTGAAPVWQEIMAMLHAGLASQPPPVPAGVRAVVTKFSPAVEPPRREWFIDNILYGTVSDVQAQRVAAVSGESGIVRIESPANGMVVAIDPDIPADRQRLPLSVKGASASMVLRLNGALLGPANRDVLWRPRPGAYRLAVENAAGSAIDQILFTVR